MTTAYPLIHLPVALASVAVATAAAGIELHPALALLLSSGPPSLVFVGGGMREATPPESKPARAGSALLRAGFFGHLATVSAALAVTVATPIPGRIAHGVVLALALALAVLAHRIEGDPVTAGLALATKQPKRRLLHRLSVIGPRAATTVSMSAVYTVSLVLAVVIGGAAIRAAIPILALLLAAGLVGVSQAVSRYATYVPTASAGIGGFAVHTRDAAAALAVGGLAGVAVLFPNLPLPLRAVPLGIGLFFADRLRRHRGRRPALGVILTRQGLVVRESSARILYPWGRIEGLGLVEVAGFPCVGVWLNWSGAISPFLILVDHASAASTDRDAAWREKLAATRASSGADLLLAAPLGQPAASWLKLAAPLCIDPAARAKLPDAFGRDR